MVFSLFSLFTVKGQDIEKDILAIMEKHDAVGVSVAVVRNNSIVYSHSFGYNPDYDHPELRNPIPQDGVFWLASVTKTFISTAIMQLVEKKKMGLDDDINNYLDYSVRNPNYPDVPITPRMLLCHRSSLNDTGYSRSNDAFETDDKDKYAANFNNYLPGTKYDYCNMGYQLLGVIIENVTGERLDVYTEKKILRPLRIKGSFDLTKIDPNKLVRSYNYDEKTGKFEPSPSVYNYENAAKRMVGYRLGHSTGYLAPAGGLKMTTNDLARFMMALMHGGRLGWRRILRSESIQEMCRPQGDDRDYGLAITTYKNIISGVPLVGMRGGSHGIHSIYAYNPEGNFGFVVISNGYNTASENKADMNYRIIRALYKDIIQKK